MEAILNNALNNDIGTILSMNIKGIDINETVYKGDVGVNSIEIIESETITTSYVYKHEEDRDTDLTTLHKLLAKGV